MITPDRKRTAYHEAGHAIVARALGRTVEHITIDFVSLRGYTQLRQEPTDPNVPKVPPPYVMANRLAHYLSGDRAEFIEFGDYDATLETTAALLFASNNTQIGPERAEQFVATVGERIDAIIRANEVHWRSLAERLMVEDRIEGTNLDSILSNVIGGDVYS